MAEGRSSFLKQIIGDEKEEGGKSFSSERQHTAQAFNLHVEKRDGRHAEGFAWSHYANYKWTDEGTHERLVILFGARALEIEGHNLGALVEGIREGKLNGVQEMVTADVELNVANGDKGPIIRSIKMHPDFEDILKELKGEAEHDTGHAARVRGR